MKRPFPVIDIFAGPGGLGEGFSAFRDQHGACPFGISVSIEKDQSAHKTLELRAFFRQFRDRTAPADYYAHLRGELPRESLFERFPREAGAARKEAWLLELGPASATSVRSRIGEAVNGHDEWLLIGGPPCQAYSLAGRSRNKGVVGYSPTRDARQTLYVEYLQILADHAPPVFVMENVKGLLSATLQSRRLFDRIVEDLARPSLALKREGRSPPRGASLARYAVYPIVAPEGGSLFSFPPSPEDFVVRAEMYGVPQARHRVILLGIREDLRVSPQMLKKHGEQIPASAVLRGLPRLRSGLSGEADGSHEWTAALRSVLNAPWLKSLKGNGHSDVARTITQALAKARDRSLERGAEFLELPVAAAFAADWYLDSRIEGVVNHSTRSHMRSDLHRYLFASAYAKAEGKSPGLAAFPRALLPDHGNVERALSGGCFADRFRVQLADRPSTTITSHISKDGHYYIHPDPSQCRSLTVREAARLQTFPDNYFFCGGRTAQYGQVGNAVPPLLARQIAAIVYRLLS